MGHRKMIMEKDGVLQKKKTVPRGLVDEEGLFLKEKELGETKNEKELRGRAQASTCIEGH